MMKKILCGILACMFLFTGMSALAAPESVEGFNVPIDIMLNGDFIACTQKPFVENGTTYIPLRALSDAISATLSWNETEKCAQMQKDGNAFLFYTDGRNSVLNGKTLENSAGKLYNNLTFVPVKAICAPLGYAVEWDGFYLIVRITAENVTVPDACKDFSYTQDDLLWLSRLVQIECGNESLATGIGVANTVLNRIASPAYPNTIREAILDTKHGVQYPPAHTEKMNCTPSKGSMIAAKCALNGTNLVGNAVAFVHVNALKNSWAANNMRRSATIGVVAFYEF